VTKRDRCNSQDFGAPDRGSGLNRLALTALNAVNVISQDGEQNTRVAFV